jgi:hypothetical protein
VDIKTPPRHGLRPWPTDDRLDGTEAFFRAQEGLTVRTIITPRAEFRTCSPDEFLVELIEPGIEFDFLPVERSIGERETIIVGLLATDIGEAVPGERAESRMIPLDERHVVDAGMSILDFLRTADDLPCRLVVDGGRVIGLVSLSDIQRLPVRAALFGIITGLEMVMTEVISRRCPELSWIQRLPGKRRRAIEKRIRDAHEGDTYVDALLLADLQDKIAVLVDSHTGDKPARAIGEKLERVRQLRNDLAHAKDYASRREEGLAVCQTVRDAVTLWLALDEEARAHRAEVECCLGRAASLAAPT